MLQLQQGPQHVEPWHEWKWPRVKKDVRTNFWTMRPQKMQLHSAGSPHLGLQLQQLQHSLMTGGVGRSGRMSVTSRS